MATLDQTDLKWEPCDAPLPFHSHAANEQLIWIKGSAAGRVGTAPQTSMKPGSFVCTPANTPHWFRCDQACQLYVSLDGPDKITITEPK